MIKRDAQRLQGVSLSDLHQVGEAACSQIMPGPRHFGRLELTGDQMAATIVPEGSGTWRPSRPR